MLHFLYFCWQHAHYITLHERSRSLEVCGSRLQIHVRVCLEGLCDGMAPARGSTFSYNTLCHFALVSAHSTHTHRPLHGVWLVVEQLIGLIDGTTYVSVSECKC